MCHHPLDEIVLIQSLYEKIYPGMATSMQYVIMSVIFINLSLEAFLFFSAYFTNYSKLSLIDKSLDSMFIRQTCIQDNRGMATLLQKLRSLCNECILC